MSKDSYTYFSQYLDECSKDKLKQEILDLRKQIDYECRYLEGEDCMSPIDLKYQQYQEEHIQPLHLALEEAEHIYKTKFGELDF